MTNNTRNYYTSSNYADHTTFGELIFYSDFNTDYRGCNDQRESSIAKRIATDMKFDERCRKNIEQNNRRKNYKKGNN